MKPTPLTSAEIGRLSYELVSLNPAWSIEGLPSAKIHHVSWLVKPTGAKRMGSVVLEFTSPVAANRAIRAGILWAHQSLEAVRYIREGRSKFCRKCQKPRHVHSHCLERQYTCGYCAGKHPTWECHVSGDRQQAKCANCNGSHRALSKDCPVYQKEAKLAREALLAAPPYHREPMHYRQPLRKEPAVNTTTSNTDSNQAGQASQPIQQPRPQRALTSRKQVSASQPQRQSATTTTRAQRRSAVSSQQRTTALYRQTDGLEASDHAPPAVPATPRPSKFRREMRDGKMVTVTMNGKVVGRPSGSSNANQSASQPEVVITRTRARAHSTPSPRPVREFSLPRPNTAEVDPSYAYKKARFENWQPLQGDTMEDQPHTPPVNNIFDEFLQMPQSAARSELFVSLQEIEQPQPQLATQPIIQRLSLTQPDRSKNLTTSEMGGKSSLSPTSPLTEDGENEDEDYHECSPSPQTAQSPTHYHRQ